MTKIKYIIGFILLSSIFLGSCKIGKSYQRPVMSDMPDTFETDGLQDGSIADIGWSTLYSDTILQQLIGQALDHNKDVPVSYTHLTLPTNSLV